MACYICGATLRPGQIRCTTCGAYDARPMPAPTHEERCPRCGYRGEGVAYFRRPSHVFILVMLSVFTWGLAGLVYWGLRRKDRVCPGCGLRKGPYRVLPRPAPAGEPRPASPETEERLPRRGGVRRIVGVGMVLLAFFLMFVGFAEGDLIPGLAAGSLVGVAGLGMIWWGRRALQARREALMARLQRRVLLLARREGGVLTASDVAAELELSIPAAERVLIAMDDGFRVRSDITREGLLLYEFPEFRSRRSLGGDVAEA